MSNFKIERVMKEVTQLPSNFGFYPKNTKIWFYPMTTKEVELLNDSNLDSKKLFENNLANIKTEGINPEELTFSDFIFISLQRRLYSQTEILCTLNSTCPKCGKRIIEEFNFSEIEFENPKDARLQSCELGDYEVVMGPITIGSMLKMLDSEEGISAIDTYAHCIREIKQKPKDESLLDNFINGFKKEKTQEEIANEFLLAREIIANTWGEERLVLNYIDSLQDHGIKPKKVVCSNCKEAWEEDLGGADALIFPSDRIGDNIRNKVHAC